MTKSAAGDRRQEGRGQGGGREPDRGRGGGGSWTDVGPMGEGSWTGARPIGEGSWTGVGPVGEESWTGARVVGEGNRTKGGRGLGGAGEPPYLQREAPLLQTETAPAQVMLFRFPVPALKAAGSWVFDASTSEYCTEWVSQCGDPCHATRYQSKLGRSPAPTQ